MKKGIHPENYRPVVFKDMSNGDVFLSRSTCNTKETIEFEGETYPLVKLEISSTSHPFYTGKSKLVDTAGRVDKFMSRSPTVFWQASLHSLHRTWTNPAYARWYRTASRHSSNVT